jgi:hypothetical protein
VKHKPIESNRARLSAKRKPIEDVTIPTLSNEVRIAVGKGRKIGSGLFQFLFGPRLYLRDALATNAEKLSQRQLLHRHLESHARIQIFLNNRILEDFAALINHDRSSMM